MYSYSRLDSIRFVLYCRYICERTGSGRPGHFTRASPPESAGVRANHSTLETGGCASKTQNESFVAFGARLHLLTERSCSRPRSFARAHITNLRPESSSDQRSRVGGLRFRVKSRRSVPNLRQPTRRSTASTTFLDVRAHRAHPVD